MSEVFENILRRQHHHAGCTHPATVPEHSPEIAIIGCVDARLRLEEDIGLPQNKALIGRNVAALVHDKNGHKSDVFSTLEFGIKAKKVKDIVVLGHTHCGGVEALLDGTPLEEVAHHLAPFEPIRDEIKKQVGSRQEQLRALEQAVVRRSVDNLMTHPAVKDAVDAGELTLHGWLIDTRTKQINVLDPHSGKFQPMTEMAAQQRINKTTATGQGRIF